MEMRYHIPKLTLPYLTYEEFLINLQCLRNSGNNHPKICLLSQQERLRKIQEEMERERKRKEAEERALREAEEVKNNVCQLVRWLKHNGSKPIDFSKPMSIFLSNPYFDPKLTYCQYSRQFKRKE